MGLTAAMGPYSELLVASQAHFAGEGTATWRIGGVNHEQATLHYRNERVLL